MLLTVLLNYAIIILQIKKAVTPTKNEPPPINKERQADYITFGEKVQDYEYNNQD